MLNKLLVPIYTMMVYTIMCNILGIYNQVHAQVLTIAFIVIAYKGVEVYGELKQRRSEVTEESN